MLDEQKHDSTCGTHVLWLVTSDVLSPATCLPYSSTSEGEISRANSSGKSGLPTTASSVIKPAPDHAMTW